MDKKEAFPIESENALVSHGGEGEIIFPYRRKRPILTLLLTPMLPCMQFILHALYCLGKDFRLPCPALVL